MTLQELIAKGIPMAYRMRYDFTNNWIPWANKVQKLIVQSVKLDDNVKEYGVEVIAGKFINFPARCRKPIKVWHCLDDNDRYEFEVVNNRIKLLDSFSNTRLDTGTMVLDLSSASEGTMYTYSTIEEDPYAGALIISDSGTHIIQSEQRIYGSSTIRRIILQEPVEGYSEEAYSVYCRLLPPGGYLMLKCTVDYPDITLPSDEVPIADKYENALITGIRIEIQREMEDLSQINLWTMLMQYDMGLLKLDSGVLKKLKHLTLDNSEEQQKNAVS